MSSEKDFTTQLEATSKVADDRVSRYIEKQLTISPLKYFEEVRFYWVAAIVLSLLSTVVMSRSVFITLSKNSESTLNFVRVDGLKVEESFDMRRDILLANSYKRAQLQQEVENER